MTGDSSSSKRIIINAVLATSQIVVLGLSLYIYLLKTLGASQLGVYTLILSTSSIAVLSVAMYFNMMS